MSRHFPTLTSTITEVQRDLARAPSINFTRVQQHVGKSIPGRELIGYHYSLPILTIPVLPELAIQMAAPHLSFFNDSSTQRQLCQFMGAELETRWDSVGRFDATPNERHHPALAHAFEGNHLSYTYSERMVGATEGVIAAFENSPDTRRAFIPIYNTTDLYRAHAATRVPCTIGYQVLGREVGDEFRLNIICYQRSCDFGRFWLTDLWFASMLCRRFAALEIGGIKWLPGLVHHMLGSLHIMEDLADVY